MQRRTFLMTVTPLTTLLGSVSRAQIAQLDEKDPQAVALGYVDDAAKVVGSKQPKYAPGQVCANCALYAGKTGDAAAPCPIFGGRLVASKGWCSAWVKKT
jgi:hypothetical protein